MSLDIKAIIADLVEKILKDDDLKAQFKKNPIKTVEKLTGVDLPDDLMEKVVDGIKARIKLDDLDLGDAAKLLKKLF